MGRPQGHLTPYICPFRFFVLLKSFFVNCSDLIIKEKSILSLFIECYLAHISNAMLRQKKRDQMVKLEGMKWLSSAAEEYQNC